MKTKKTGSIGSSFEDFLREEGAYEETRVLAIKRVLSWRIKRDGSLPPGMPPT